jgi:hypothetical protein
MPCSERAYLGGNRRDEQNLKSSAPSDFGPAIHHASDRLSHRGLFAPLVGTGDRRRRAIHVRGRCLHRQCCDTNHCRRIARQFGADRGGDRDLSHCLCLAGDYRRPARRYLRHPECISGRRARLHTHVAVVRAGANRTRIDPRAAGAGRDRGADGAAGARHPSSAVFRFVAWPGLWHLRHGAWPSGRGRLFARRRAGDVGSGGIGLARGVFRQPAVRPDHHACCLADHAVDTPACRYQAGCSRRDRACSRDCCV